MKKHFFTLLLSCFSSISLANFDYQGPGELIYPTGVKKPFKFGFAWDSKNQQFRIGPKSYSMSDLPESYSIALTLSKDESKIWVQEFNPGFIETFNWQLGDHKIQLNKKNFKQAVKGNYVLTLNNTDYFFVRNNISIEVKFNEKGIDNIKIDGVTKDMGAKK